MPDSVRRAEYAALLAGSRAHGDRGALLFVTSPGAALDRGPPDLYGACGLALALAARGWGVVVAPASAEGDPPPLGRCDAVIATSPVVDPAQVPAGTPCIAWMSADLDAWVRAPRLSMFDAALVASPLALAEVRDVYDGPADVLAPAVDTALFRAPGGGVERRDGVVALGSRWPRGGPLERALLARRSPATARALVHADEVDLPLGLPDAALGLADFFSWPGVLRSARVAVHGQHASAVSRGIVATEVLAALAAGVLPVVDSRLGLREMGLDDVPAWRPGGTDDELDTLLDGLLVDRAGTQVRTDRLAAVVRAEHDWAARAGVVVDALDLVRRSPTPITVGFSPDFRRTNPYQRLLYAGLRRPLFRVAPVRDVVDEPVLREDGSISGEGGRSRLDGYVFHVHWTSGILQDSASAFDARGRLDRFREHVDALKVRGGRLVWTVHNLLPHELRYRGLEQELCRYLAEQADLVHVMCRETVDLAARLYRLDASKVAVVPHSSYDGVYPDLVDRAGARRRLGLRPHEVALLAVGGIRPYHGLDLLLEAFAALQAEDVRLRLLVAGPPRRSPDLAALRARCTADPRVLARFERVPEAELQLWYHAADAAVLPYRAILNSGAFKLAETFGLPIVAPSDGCLRARLDPSYAIGFSPGDLADLLRALRQVVELATDPDRADAARAAARAASRSYPPDAMARDFAAALGSLWGRVAAPT